MDTKKLRQKILDLAIHGKLVPQDPNDEPASVLLERIKAEKERLIKEGKIKRSKKRTKTSDTPHYENVPFEIPDNWVWCKIKDIGEIVTGNTPSKNNAGYYGGNIPFFKPTDLEQGRDTKYARDYLSLLGFEQSRKLPVNTILVTCIGATIGKTGINTVSGSCNQQINAIIPNNGAYFLFIYYVCISNYMQCKIKKHASATTLPILNKGNFENFSFPLPPLAEQQRIVTEIEHWFALIDKIEQNKSDLKAIIKQTKNKLLDIAIHGKLVPQDLNDEPASELLKRINPKAEITCDNAQYEKIPENWCVCKLVDICSFLSRGKSPKYSEYDKTYPVFAQKCNLKDGGISLEQARFLDPSTINKWNEVYKLQTGDILVNSTGTGTVGRTRLFNANCLGNYPFVVPDSHVSVVRVVKSICPQYVYAYISSDSIQQYIEENLAGSTNQKELYIGVLENMHIFLPPLAEQYRIVTKIEKLFSSLDNIQKALEV